MNATVKDGRKTIRVVLAEDQGMVLGALAALVRLAKFAHIVTGISLWSCVLLMLCLSALTSITSPEQIWRWIERSRQ